mgnify:CR=1 FL=1
MKIGEFVKTFTEKKIINTKINEHAVSDYLKKELEIKTYIPFREKRKIAEMVVEQNIEVINGIKKYKNIDAYIGFIMASVVAHTNLECSDNPIEDYDLLAESGLLLQIVAEFQESHNEIDILLKMLVAYELEDNQPGALIGRFLDGILKKLDDVSEFLGGIDLKETFSEENMAKIVGLLNK